MRNVFFEAIRIVDGKAANLEWHNWRFNNTLQSIYSAKREYKLEDYLTNVPTEGLYKCKVVYSRYIDEISFHPYVRKPFNQFILVDCDISYEYTYLDRSEIDTLKGEYDEIIFVKNGKITDTSVANIAFFIDGMWLTPRYPLLHGTTRQRLLDSNQLTLADISVEAAVNSEIVAVMNSMVGFFKLPNSRILTLH